MSAIEPLLENRNYLPRPALICVQFFPFPSVENTPDHPEGNAQFMRKTRSSEQAEAWRE
jgi:hypothetical protein